MAIRKTFGGDRTGHPPMLIFPARLSTRKNYYLKVATMALQLVTVPRLNVPFCGPVIVTCIDSVAAVETRVAPVF